MEMSDGYEFDKTDLYYFLKENKLGCFYEKIKINYDLMFYFYKMASDNGDKFAMYKLSDYFLKTKRDYSTAIFYCIKALENGYLLNKSSVTKLQLKFELSSAYLGKINEELYDKLIKLLNNE